mmetsp:Transcript_7292/g.10952  ORF Transcript_7292/g.10952 Transcript_7292/m.10952 type:complete len:437 (-) Transcript_7292:38-1348(-)|eukprot:CAMPEP_0113944444 /NCGR_PEP_ID=MMETSP1339-20121228/34426_1 /TAXON_ID=94617 /ORGANISM="Fibrocapsa japonica" /LENGTH=436 /DNA_ID=CAMNT_0000949655 /DNA_START=53 /DNA_END=1363 /DNA_ORIENTATION=+ /assembly_acc=CAM_ASM_000762
MAEITNILRNLNPFTNIRKPNKVEDDASVTHSDVYSAGTLKQSISVIHGSGKSQTNAPFHVHFGGGRIGLGLVSPAIERSGVPYAIVELPVCVGDIVNNGSGSMVDIVVNGAPVIKNLELVLDDVEVANLGTRSLLCTTSSARLLELVRRATSFTCSLGPVLSRVLFPLLSQLPKDKDAKDRPVLYACENDHKAVDVLAEELGTCVRVVNCMIDRICTGRETLKTSIEVTTEAYRGSIVLLTPKSPDQIIPFAGDNVTIPDSESEANFFYEKKLFLVNGMHTTLAFMTLRKEQPTGSTPLDHSLMTWATADETLQDEMWAWAVSRCGMLILRHGMDLLFKVYNTQDKETVYEQLLSFARTALDRFSGVEDKTARILGGGVTNRWSTRLRPVVDDMMDILQNDDSSGIFHYANIDEEYVQTTTQKLVDGTRRFCDLD